MNKRSLICALTSIQSLTPHALNRMPISIRLRPTARLILALADGQSYREMVRGMRTSAATIARWRRRFEQDRLAGLEGRHRGSKPRTATPAVQARVVRRVQQQPSDGSTHWSCRKLAGELGVSKSTVQRILMQARLKPHRL